MSPRRVLGSFPSDPDLSLGTTKAEAGEDEHLVFAPHAVIVRVSEGRGGFPCAPTFSSSARSLGDQGLSLGSAV